MEAFTIQGQMKYYIISMEQVSMETHLCCYKFTAAQRDYNENWILSKRKFKELDYRTKMTLHGVFGHNKRLYNPHNYFHIFKKCLNILQIITTTQLSLLILTNTYIRQYFTYKEEHMMFI